MTESIRATREYLQRLRRVTEWEKTWLSRCGTPKSLPLHLLVKEVEFVRERDFPHQDKALYDCRVHFEDGTYDCVSFLAGTVMPVEGKYFARRRFSFSKADDYTTWREDCDEPPNPVFPGLRF